MHVTTSRASDGTIRYEAKASVEEVARARVAAYGEFAASLGLTGLDVSPKAIQAKAEELMGLKDVDGIVAPKVVAKLVALAIDAKPHRPAFTPKAQTATPVKEGAPCAFAFTLTPKPSLVLSDFDRLSVNVEIPAVTEDLIDQEILCIAGNYLPHGENGEAVPANGPVEINDEWVKANAPWFKDYQGMRRIVRKNLEELNEASLENRKRTAAAKELAKHLEGDIENGSYEEMVENLRQGLVGQIKQAGGTWDDFVESQGGEDAIKMALLIQAREILTQGYALDALFAREKLTLAQDDIDKACEAMNPGWPAHDTYETAKAMGKLHTLNETAERFKANDWLVEHADITVTYARAPKPEDV